MKIRIEHIALGNSQEIRIRQEFDAKWQQNLRAIHTKPSPQDTVHCDNALPLNNALAKKLEGIRL